MSGGESAANNGDIFPVNFRTIPRKDATLTFNVARSSPWMILPKLTSRLSTSDNTSASNATSNRSSLVSLLKKVNLTGMNCAGLPRPCDGTRSTACSRDAIVSVSKGKSTASRHVAVLRFAAPGAVMARSPSGSAASNVCAASFRYASFCSRNQSA